VAIKQSVYVMPFSEQSREDLSGTLKEIIDGGGDGSISKLRFVEAIPKIQMFKEKYGYSLRFPNDLENIQRQFEVYDDLYSWCRLDVACSQQ
jgi:hypothetical protein